ncbi:MAG: HAMP domain-containing protein [Deltaproteobacteria bacterium]|nr:HAMP domain-containing protein [Deltaproteobacteria bacterium]
MGRLAYSLSLKVTLLIAAILIAGFGILVVLNIRQEMQDRVAKNLETARLLAASVTTSIQNGMLEGRPDIIRRLVQDMKSQLTEVHHLEVYRRNGVEAFSDLETVKELEFAGYLQPDLVERISKMTRQPGARISHPLFSRAVENVAPQETYEPLGGGRALTLFQPLRNLTECHDCHGEDHKVRGVVRITLGMERLDAELRTARNRQIAVALFTILGVTVTLIAFMRRLVLRPLARVTAVAREIGGGDFDARVKVESRDEIGQLGAVINDMSSRLKKAYEDLETKNKVLDETLNNLKDSMKRVELLEQLKGELSKFVPESVKQLLEKNPDATELEKREKDVSVLFLDIAGYTRLSEQMDPKQLNRLIQNYFSSFLEIIHEHQGDVNETAGDGLMVIFQSDGPASEHALNATRSAFAIRRRVEELNEEFAGVFQPVFLHMGINSGVALVGATKLSSAAGARWTFTATGPVTNLAARIAGQATEGDILVSPATAEPIKSYFVLEDIGERALKNVAEPVRLYRVVPPGLYHRVET